MNGLFWFLLILVILFLLFLFIIFTKLTILAEYHHHNDNDDLKLEFRIWFGIIRYRRHIPLIKVDDDSPSIIVKTEKPADGNEQSSDTGIKQITEDSVKSYLEKAKDFLHKVSGLKVIIKKFLMKIKIKKFEWHSLIGLGNAAHTGIAAGGLWAIKGSALGILSHNLSLVAEPHISITPHFQATVIQTRISCIFQFRIGHAILAGLKLIKFWRGAKTSASNKTNFSNEKMKSV